MHSVLSKSKYLSALQCPKLLWTHYNRAQLVPPPDPATQWILDQGHEVGRLAQQLVPGGVEVPFGAMQRTVAATAELLPQRKPIYEASSLADGVYCCVDIPRPAGNDSWDVLEVKSSSTTKDINLHDLAVQRHALLAAGLRIERLVLVHLNREYVRQGELDIQQLFVLEDVNAPGRSPSKQAPDLDLEPHFCRATIGHAR